MAQRVGLTMLALLFAIPVIMATLTFQDQFSAGCEVGDNRFTSLFLTSDYTDSNLIPIQVSEGDDDTCVVASGRSVLYARDGSNINVATSTVMGGTWVDTNDDDLKYIAFILNPLFGIGIVILVFLCVGIAIIWAE